MEDIENMKAILDFKGMQYTANDFVDYSGSESVNAMHDEIILDNDNLISFN